SLEDPHRMQRCEDARESQLVAFAVLQVDIGGAVRIATMATVLKGGDHPDLRMCRPPNLLGDDRGFQKPRLTPSLGIAKLFARGIAQQGFLQPGRQIGDGSRSGAVLAHHSCRQQTHHDQGSSYSHRPKETCLLVPTAKERYYKVWDS